MNANMTPSEIIATIRNIRRKCVDTPTIYRLLNLEIDAAPAQPEDYTTDVLGFDTVLSYLAKTNPEALALISDPIHETVIDGKRLAESARKRGLPIIKVAAPAHIKARYPKIAYVNAYPVHLLAEHLG
jgi:hypothetical protein